ncbi:hypothetical protein BGW80DRAFT_838526 [Lactifluus volemus]|nr:hypothetical protein BGW80DRAFT_838526 [Lactifluus volemus]
MDDFLSQQASLNPAGLYRSPDGGLSLIPAGPYGPGELESNDELGLLSSSNPTPPLHHPGITEPQDSEEYPCLRDPHRVYMCPPLFKVEAFHTEPYQRASSSYAFDDNGSLTESIRVGQGISALGFRSQRESHRARHLQSHQGIWGGNPPSRKLAYPAQVAGIYFDRNYGPTTLLGEQNSKPSCPTCGKKLHAMKAVNRHWDDLHSIPQKCPYLNCNGMLTGKRKLKGHLYRHHNGVSPP